MAGTSQFDSCILDENAMLFDNDDTMIDDTTGILANRVLDEQIFSLDPLATDCKLSEDMIQILRGMEQLRERLPLTDLPEWPAELQESMPMPMDKVFFDGLNSNEIDSLEIPMDANPAPYPTIPIALFPYGTIPVNSGQMHANGPPHANVKSELEAVANSQIMSPTLAAVTQIVGSSQQSNNEEEMAKGVAAAEFAEEKAKAVRTAEEKREARAERNRQYARQSRLRLKLLVHSLERSVSEKRTKNARLQKKLDDYMQRLETILARGGDAHKESIVQALEICRDTRKKCTWTYEKSRHERVEIKTDV